MHAVLNDTLRTFELEEWELNPHEPFKEFLSAAAFTIQSVHHTTLGATPAQLVFGRDMTLPIKHEVDWTLIRQKHQAEINQNNARENKSCIEHEHKVGDKVMQTVDRLQRKMSTPRTGPFNVAQVYDNGTVQLNALETVNIRRLVPHVVLEIRGESHHHSRPNRVLHHECCTISMLTQVWPKKLPVQCEDAHLVWCLPDQSEPSTVGRKSPRQKESTNRNLQRRGLQRV